jgi:putative endonuclease
MNRYYIGVSSDVESRLRRHLSNHSGYTGKAKDWELVYEEKYATESEALSREKQLKKWKSSIRIKELIIRNQDAPGSSVS